MRDVVRRVGVYIDRTAHFCSHYIISLFFLHRHHRHIVDTVTCVPCCRPNSIRLFLPFNFRYFNGESELHD